MLEHREQVQISGISGQDGVIAGIEITTVETAISLKFIHTSSSLLLCEKLTYLRYQSSRTRRVVLRDEPSDAGGAVTLVEAAHVRHGLLREAGHGREESLVHLLLPWHAL